MITRGGDGSARRPFYIDSNDALLRAVPSTPGLSRFIDNDWVELFNTNGAI